MNLDNEFIFFAGRTGLFQEFGFTETAHSVTNSDYYWGVTSELTDEGGKAIVKNKRDGSKKVADWFRREAGSGVPQDLPPKLNFAVNGILKIKLRGVVAIFENLIISQGHVGGHNYWWVGGRLFTTIGGNGVLYGDGKVITAPDYPCTVTIAMNRLYGKAVYKFETSIFLNGRCS